MLFILILFQSLTCTFYLTHWLPILKQTFKILLFIPRICTLFFEHIKIQFLFTSLATPIIIEHNQPMLIFSCVAVILIDCDAVVLIPQSPLPQSHPLDIQGLPLLNGRDGFIPKLEEPFADVIIRLVEVIVYNLGRD